MINGMYWPVVFTEYIPLTLFHLRVSSIARMARNHDASPVAVHRMRKSLGQVSMSSQLSKREDFMDGLLPILHVYWSN